MSYIDNRKGVILVLLDLSAAFDTVEHGILLSLTESRLGINGTVLNWFQSCLNNRTQKVSLGKSLSSLFNLQYGVPQGSVLGPILLTIYILSMGVMGLLFIYMPMIHKYIVRLTCLILMTQKIE